MPLLRESQIGFASALLDAASPWPQTALRGEGIAAAQRVQVYRNNLRESLLAALLAVYPVIARLVGEGFFRQCARDYLREFPSTSGDIHDFGESFADFLSTLPLLEPYPYMADVARLEWAWHRAYHAPDVRGYLDLSRLSSISEDAWQRSQFVLHPSVQVLGSSYPVLRIWEVNQDGYEGEDGVALDEGAQRVLIQRRGINVELHAISSGEYALLTQFLKGAVLAEACEWAAFAEPGFDLAMSLTRFIHQGVFVALRCPEERAVGGAMPRPRTRGSDQRSLVGQPVGAEPLLQNLNPFPEPHPCTPPQPPCAA